jgi:hypothetical protein
MPHTEAPESKQFMATIPDWNVLTAREDKSRANAEVSTFGAGVRHHISPWKKML